MRAASNTAMQLPPPFDLFGDVPVRLEEVLAWMLAVPGIAPTSRRFFTYLRDYRVIEKIKAAKIAGTFDQAIAGAVAPAPYRLAAAIDAAECAARAWARAVFR